MSNNNNNNSKVSPFLVEILSFHIKSSMLTNNKTVHKAITPEILHVFLKLIWANDEQI